MAYSPGATWPRSSRPEKLPFRPELDGKDILVLLVFQHEQDLSQHIGFALVKEIALDDRELILLVELVEIHGDAWNKEVWQVYMWSARWTAHTLALALAFCPMRTGCQRCTDPFS